MKKTVLISLAVMGIIIILLNIKPQPLAVLAWGDDDGGRSSYTTEGIGNGAIDAAPVSDGDDCDSIKRPTYSIQQVNEGALGDAITFNSIKIADSDYEWYKAATGSDIPRGTIRNETDFVGARENTGVNVGADNVWEGTEIAAEDGKTYIIRLYVHNNNPNGFDAVAEDTEVRFYVPYASAATQTVNGWLRSSNAAPNEYSDTVNFNSANGVPFHLEYINGSALLENGGLAKGAGVQLPDSLVNQGSPTDKAEDEWTLIGYDALDGRIPGCYEYANYVSIEVRVVYDYEFTTETQVRLAGDEEWQDAVEAKVGDKVEFQVTYQNTGSITQNNVLIRNVLPPNLYYIENTTKIKNSSYPDGINIADGKPSDILNTINIGNYAPGANAKIMFTAEVVDDDLADGSNALYNWGQAGVGSTVLQDYATVMVYNDRIFKMIILGLSILIFVCLVFIGVLLVKKRRLEQSSAQFIGEKGKR